MKMNSVKKVFAVILSLAMIFSTAVVSVSAASAGVTKSALSDFYPGTDTYNVVSGYNAQTGYGTVVLTDEVPTATDLAFCWYYGSHYLGYPKGYTWISVSSANSNIATATATSTADGLKVDFEKGSVTGTTTIYVDYTVTQLRVQSGAASDSQTNNAVSGRLVYTVTNNASGAAIDPPVDPTVKPDLPDATTISKFADASLGAVRVQCVQKASHVGKISDLSAHPDGYTLSEVVPNDGSVDGAPVSVVPWMCVLTLNNEYWVNLFNANFASSWGAHLLDAETTGVVSTKLFSNGTNWYFVTTDAPLYVYVTECTHADADWTDNQNGTHSYICNDCGTVLAGPNAHKWVMVDGTSTATCTEPGTATYECSLCGAIKNDAAPATGNHVDADHDGHCDSCDAFLGTGNGGTGETGAAHSQEGLEWVSVDANNHNGYCKTCHALIVEHESHDMVMVPGTSTATCDHDGTATFKCEKCGYVAENVPVSGGHVDANDDGICDNCNQPIGGNTGDDPNNPGTGNEDQENCNHVDNDKDGYCDKCGKELGHKDDDGDDRCDYCGDDMQKHCNCWCHREGKIYKAIYKIMRAFWKLFGINKYCKCGKNHFPTILDLIK